MFTPPKLLTHGVEEKAVKGGVLSNASGIKRGAVRFLTSSPFGALVNIYFISVVWRKEVGMLRFELLNCGS